ncbi:MAG TPA: hypothetical protein VHO70_23375 [Chitinispirillaceae bacterium]|nr:hypothetical protein [Chitinispirillaceae bacterium]
MAEIRITKAQLQSGSLNIKLRVGEQHTFLIETGKHAVIIEFEDKLFRTNSAVVLPDREDPSSSAGNSRSVSAVGIAAFCLRYMQEHPDKKMIITGHTDTAGGVDYNRKLSRWRAECITSVLKGDKKRFAEICKSWERMKVSDYKQILTWLSETRGWDCNPGPINDSHDNKTQTAVNNFKKAYNESGPGSSWAAKVTPWGEANNQETWEAYFNCYEEYLAEQLGTDLAGVNTLRSTMKFIHPNMWTGCNEYQPRVAQNLDSFPCDSNRRVEVAFFDPGEEPALECNPNIDTCNKQECPLYKKTDYTRIITPPMISAKEWKCIWENIETPVTDHASRTMIIDVPGLPNGTPAQLQVFIKIGDNEKAYGNPITASVNNEKIEHHFDSWYLDNFEREFIELNNGEQFPDFRFCYTLSSGGRSVRAPYITYADKVSMKFRFGSETGSAVANARFTLYSQWGCYHGTTDDNGNALIDKVPPGGAIVMLDSPRLVY